MVRQAWSLGQTSTLHQPPSHRASTAHLTDTRVRPSRWSSPASAMVWPAAGEAGPTSRPTKKSLEPSSASSSVAGWGKELLVMRKSRVRINGAGRVCLHPCAAPRRRCMAACAFIPAAGYRRSTCLCASADWPAPIEQRAGSGSLPCWLTLLDAAAAQATVQLPGSLDARALGQQEGCGQHHVDGSPVAGEGGRSEQGLAGELAWASQPSRGLVLARACLRAESGRVWRCTSKPP